MPERSAGGITRRALLRDGSAVTLAVLAAGPGALGGDVAVALADGGPGFLTSRELRILRAVVDVIVPEDDTPGGAKAGCAEAIDALLAAFAVDPPRIYAGAPFSDRGGSPVNHFERFLPLDRYERRAWRLRIEGGEGPGGRVKGLQAIYRDGLRALGDGFAALPAPLRELALRQSSDPAVGEMMDVAVPHTMQFMYGAPEYGGNRGLTGWRSTGYHGDVQPRGFTREEVEQPEPGLPALTREQVRDLVDELGALLALGGSAEASHGILVRSGGTLAGLRRELAALRRAGRR